MLHNKKYQLKLSSSLFINLSIDISSHIIFPPYSNNSFFFHSLTPKIRLLIFPSSCHTLSCKFSFQLIIWCNNVDQNDNFYHWLLINILIICLLDNTWLWRRSYKTVNYFLVHSLSLLIEKPIGERMPQQATGFKFILYSNVLKVPLCWLNWFSFIQLITTFHPFY